MRLHTVRAACVAAAMITLSAGVTRLGAQDLLSIRRSEARAVFAEGREYYLWFAGTEPLLRRESWTPKPGEWDPRDERMKDMWVTEYIELGFLAKNEQAPPPFQIRVALDPRRDPTDGPARPPVLTNPTYTFPNLSSAVKPDTFIGRARSMFFADAPIYGDVWVEAYLMIGKKIVSNRVRVRLELPDVRFAESFTATYRWGGRRGSFEPPSSNLLAQPSPPAPVASSVPGAPMPLSHAESFGTHTNSVHELASSPDGKLLASSSWPDRQLKVWTLPSGELKYVFSTAGSDALAISPDRKWLVSGFQKQVDVWNLEDGKYVATLIGFGQPIRAIAFSPDSTRMAIGTASELTLWSWPDGKCLAAFTGESNAGATSLVFSADGETLISSLAGTIQFRRVSTGVILRQLSDHADDGLVLATRADQGVLLSVSESATLRSWRLSDGTLTSTVSGIDTGTTAMSADGRALASVGAGQKINVRSLPDGRRIGEVAGSGDRVFALAVTPDGKFVAAAEEFGRIYLLETGGEKRRWILADRSLGTSSRRPVVVAPTASPADPPPSWSTGSAVYPSLLRAVAPGSWWVHEVAFTADARSIVTRSGADEAYQVIDVATGARVEPLGDREPFGYERLAFSPDGALCAVRSKPRAGEPTLKIYRLPKFELLRTIRDVDVSNGTFWWMPNSKRILLQNGRFVRIWSTDNGQAVGGFETAANVSAISPDGAYVGASTPPTMGGAAAKDGHRVEIIPLANPAGRVSFVAHSANIGKLAFSPDGRLLATASRDGTVKLWTVPDGQLVRTFSGHSGYVRAVHFTPDGKTVISGALDGTVRLWDVTTGAETGRYEVAKWEVNDLDLSPDGATLAVGDQNGHLLLFDFAQFTDRATSALASSEEAMRAPRPAFPSPERRRASAPPPQAAPQAAPQDFANLVRLTLNPPRIPWIRRVMFAADGAALVVHGSPSDVPVVFSTATGARDTTWNALSAGGGPSYGIEFSRDWTRYAVRRRPDGSGEVIDVFSVQGRTLLQGVRFGDSTTARKFSGTNVRIWWLPDGASMLVSTRSNASAWSATSGARLSAFAMTSDVADVSADGRFVASVSGRETATIDEGNRVQVEIVPLANPGARTMSASQRHWVSVVAFSGDGKLLATGGVDRTVKLYSVPDGKLVRSMEGHDGTVNALRFTADGRTIISGGDDETLRLWDVGTGRETGRATLAGVRIECLDVSADHAMVAIGDNKNRVLVLDFAKLRTRAVDELKHIGNPR